MRSRYNFAMESPSMNLSAIGQLVEALTQARPPYADRHKRGLALPLASVAAEIEEWLAHWRPSAWGKTHNRESLESDLVAAIASVGQHLEVELSNSADHYLAAVRRIATKAAPSPAEREDARANGHVLLAAVTTPRALRAAWDDVVAVVSQQAPRRTVLQTTANFDAVVERSGRDPSAVSQTLRGLLVGAALDIDEVRFQLGDIERAPEPARFQQVDDLSATERLELSRRYLGLPGKTGRCVVWLSVAPARLDSAYVDVGGMFFVEARWAIPNARSDSGQRFPHRDELRGPWVGLREVGNGPDDSAEVLVRIDLGRRAAAGAIEDALASVRAVTEAAAVQSAGGLWRPNGWEMLLVDGRVAATRHGMPPHVQGADAYPINMDRTAGYLVEHTESFARSLRAQQLPYHLAEALRSATEARDADARSAIILRVRVLELVASYAGLRGVRDLAKPLGDEWPYVAVRQELSAAVHDALSYSPFDEAYDPDVAQRVEVLARAIRTHEEDLSFRLDFEAAVRLREELLATSAGSFKQRRIDWAIRVLTDASAYVAALDERQQDTTLLSGRLFRVRNALAHGSPAPQATIASVGDFAEFLSRTAVRLGLEEFADATSIQAGLGQLEQSRRAFRESLERGRPMIPVDATEGAAEDT